MKKLLLSLFTLSLFSCEKSLEGNDLVPQNLKVTDVGVTLNTAYRVQQMSGGQWVDIPEKVTITFINNQKIEEKRGSNPGMVNDYAILGKGSASDNSLRIKFFALTTQCGLGNCPVIIKASENSEIYKQNGELFLIRHDDALNKVYKLM